MPVAFDRWLPWLFVLTWSTGFIGAKLALPYAQPFTILAIRCPLVALVLAAIALRLGARMPRRAALWGHQALVGLLLNAVYLGGLYQAIDAGVAAGTTALIVSLQPLIVGALAWPLLGERVRPRQWLGLWLGLVGCGMVVQHKLGTADAAAILACVLALAAITAGTLWQKRFGAGVDALWAVAIQQAAATLVLAPLALVLEDRGIDWTGSFVFALAWLVLVMGVAAAWLLLRLIRSGAASRVASLFFLVPPTTALMAWLVFGETLRATELAGMALATFGVALAARAG